MSGSDTAEQRGKVQVGDQAPDFTLPDQMGRPVSLHDFIGKSVVVLYFYPKDNTPGCTTEAVCFRDSYVVFKQAGAEVIGVSSDSSESHQQFADQHRLPFILLSDQGAAVRKRYGVPTTFGLLPGRVTYIIDRRGVVRHIFSSQFNPEKHVEEALNIVRALQSEEGSQTSQAAAEPAHGEA
ncbi:peroxiredoxin [Thermogemmatispora sp.]|uniref:peroxiredoxin n=1 Tax=Thermogemmatispora sp. TaxID=1968838 RepID=UPI0035E45233